MSRSHFQFECEGIRVEISGDERFVEKMYRQIMRDIDAARPDDESIQSRRPRAQTPHDQVVWLVRAGEMMRRIYMTETRNLQDSPVTRLLDAERIGTLYADKETFERLFPDIQRREETLWAELTDEGRRRIGRTDQ